MMVRRPTSLPPDSVARLEADMALNSTSASLLGLLHDGEHTGGELVRTATDLLGDFWSVPRSQVYRELTTLAKDGLIKERATGPRGRRPYAITAAGRAAFRRWLATPPGNAYARNPLLLRLTFAEHLTPADLKQLVSDERAHHVAQLAEYEQRAADLTGRRADPFTQACVSFGCHLERAMIAWLDEVPRRLGGRAKRA